MYTIKISYVVDPENGKSTLLSILQVYSYHTLEESWGMADTFLLRPTNTQKIIFMSYRVSQKERARTSGIFSGPKMN